MIIRHVLGYFLIFIIFGGLFAVGWKTIGFKLTLLTYGITLAMAAIMAAASLLITS
jgi:hypothetical protein